MHPDDANQIDYLQELNAIQAESIGWLPLGEGAYLHMGAEADTPPHFVVEVVGIADASMAGLNVLWLV